MHAAALIAAGTAGFLVSGGAGAAAGVVAWTLVLIAWWRFRMACENRTKTIDELERRYDRGLKSAPDKIRQDASEEPKDDASV